MTTLAVSSLVAMVLVEGFLRTPPIARLYVEPPPEGATIIGATHQELFIEYDSLLGWKKVANSANWFESTEWRVREVMNSQGLRGPEVAFSKKVGERRILLLGDSFVEGYTQDLEGTVGAYLQAELSDYEEWTVINGGTGGYSTDQELLFFESEGFRYRPDITVLFFYFNDVWYNGQQAYHRGGKPRFVLTEDGLTLTNVPVQPIPSQAGGTNAAAPPSGDPATPVEGSADRDQSPRLRDRVAFYRLVRTVVWNNESLRVAAARLRIIGSSELWTPPPWWVWRKARTQEVDAVWGVTAALLDRLKRSTESVESRLIVFYIPEKESVFLERWRDTRRRYGFSEDDWDITADEAHLMRICAELQMECIDPTLRFREVGRKGFESSELYWNRDSHWSRGGHRLAAQILADYIKSDSSGTGEVNGS